MQPLWSPFQLNSLLPFLVLPLLALLCSGTAPASTGYVQTGKVVVWGLVKNLQYGSPLPGVSITDKRSGQFLTRTNSIGRYRLELPASALQQGPVTLVFSKSGYQTLERDLKEPKPFRIDLYMQKQ